MKSTYWRDMCVNMRVSVCGDDEITTQWRLRETEQHARNRYMGMNADLTRLMVLAMKKSVA